MAAKKKKLLIGMAPSLYERLQNHSKEKGLTVSECVREMLADALGDESLAKIDDARGRPAKLAGTDESCNVPDETMRQIADSDWAPDGKVWWAK